MGFDSVFNGDPTTPNVTSSGNASFGIDLSTGQLYFRDTVSAGWHKVAGGSGGGTSNDITNESAVLGTTVTDALNTLNSNAGSKTLVVTIPSAQVLTLNSAPVVLVPGTPGNIIQMNWGYIRYIAGSTMFNPQPADNIIFIHGTGGPTGAGNFFTNYANGQPAITFVDQSVDMGSWFDGWWSGAFNSGTALPITDFIGQPVSLAQGDNQTPPGADWTQGNGSLKVFINYTVIEA